MRPNSNNTCSNRIGLIAGWGRFPIHVASALNDAGYEVVCCGIKGHADSELTQVCKHFRWFGMAKMGAQLRFFQRHNVTQATLAGKIFKTILFKPNQIFRHLPDLTSLRFFYPMFVTKTIDRKDDTLLTAVTDLFGSGGVQMMPATDFAPELLAPEGTLAGKQPSKNEWNDIHFAWRLAKQMGQLDVGQSVAVKGQAVLAVEAVEGTDECIRRAGKLCSANGFVVAKVAKPQQDMRFDVPTVGLSTIETMHQTGGKILAIEAGKTIVLDQERFVTRAKGLKITVVAI